MSLVKYTVDLTPVSGFSGTEDSGLFPSLLPPFEQAYNETDMAIAATVMNNFKSFILSSIFNILILVKQHLMPILSNSMFHIFRSPITF